MSDNDWEDLVSVLPIKNERLPGAAVEPAAYSSRLPNINSKHCYKAVCNSSTAYLFFFHLHLGTNSPKSSELMSSVLRNSKVRKTITWFLGVSEVLPSPLQFVLLGGCT